MLVLAALLVFVDCGTNVEVYTLCEFDVRSMR